MVANPVMNTADIDKPRSRRFTISRFPFGPESNKTLSVQSRSRDNIYYRFQRASFESMRLHWMMTPYQAQKSFKGRALLVQNLTTPLGNLKCSSDPMGPVQEPSAAR